MNATLFLKLLLDVPVLLTDKDEHDGVSLVVVVVWCVENPSHLGNIVEQITIHWCIMTAAMMLDFIVSVVLRYSCYV